MEENEEQLMNRIIAAIEEAGYVPYDQLRAYLKTWDDRYITRHGNARAMIRGINRDILIRCLEQLGGQY